MINYGNPVSGYVDYKFGEVGEVRRQRYLDNFYASEAVRQTAAELEAAPFEGDMAYRDQLLQNTDNVLNSIAEKGDYENLTVAVSRAATGYQKRAKPIEQNRQRYAAYQEELKKQYEAGDIDYEDYEKHLAWSMLNDDGSKYTGIQVDENGNATGFFNGRTAVKNPEINEMLKEALNGMKADGQTTIRRVIGQGPNGMLEVETERGIETISGDRVESAMRMVMEDPRVTSYINRKAVLRTALLDDQQAADMLTSTVEQINQTASQVDGMIENARSQEEKDALMQQKNQLIQNAGKLNTLIESGDGDKMRNQLQQLEANKINAMYTQAARDRYSYTQTTDSYKEDYDKLFLIDYKIQQETAAANVIPYAPTVSGAFQSYESPSGKTVEDKTSYLSNINNQITAMQQDGYFDDVLPGMTYDQVANMTEAQFVEARGGNVPAEELALFRQQKTAVLELEGERAAMRRLLDEAGEATGENAEARLARGMSVAGVPEAIAKIQQAFPTMSEAEAFELYKGYANNVRAQRYIDYGEDPGEYQGSWYEGWMNFSGGGAQSYQDRTDESIKSTMDDLFGDDTSVSAISKNITKQMQESDEILSKYLTSKSRREFTPSLSTSVPGMTLKTQQAVDRLWKDSNPRERGTAFVSKQTGRTVAFDEILIQEGIADNMESARALMQTAEQVGPVLYNPANQGIGGGTAEIKYKIGDGETSKTISVQVPFSHMDVPEINEYMQGTSYQFMRQATMQRSHGVETPIVTILRPSGDKVRVSVNLDNGTATILDGPGATGRPISLDAALDQNGAIGRLGEYGATIVAN